MIFHKLLFLNLLCVLPLFAKPEGFHLKAGDAAPPMSEKTDHWVVRSSGNTILEWDQFSIQPQEYVQFLQSDSSFCVLNRVTGPLESSLLGTLQSNGQLILINPQGIVMGADARIETAGFIASALDVLDADFLKGSELLFFAQNPGDVINYGTIHCPSGDVVLLGRTVKNLGTAEAPEGLAALAAGTEILLKPDGAQRVFVRAGAISSLEQAGAVQALAVEMKAGASPYAKAIQCSGIVEALNVKKKGGEIYLFADSGICEVSGKLIAANDSGIGGTIHVLGEKVALLDAAEIDASGLLGGGTILIGGDYQGGNPEIQNAKQIFVGADAKITADSLENGNGGKVILWSDESTRYYGAIGIRGGAKSGDGGFAEVSGKYLDFHGIVRGEAAFGKDGSVLLDPTDIQIMGMAAPTGGSFTGGVWTSTANSAVIPASVDADSVSELLATVDVLIDTTAGAQAGTGTLNVIDPVSWNSPHTLTLISNEKMTISASITATSGGSIVLTGNSTTDNALVFASGTVSTDTGTITASGTTTSSNDGTRGVWFNGGSLSSGSGTISVTGTATNTGGHIGVSFDGANAITSTSGNVTVSGMNTATGNGSNCDGIEFNNTFFVDTTGDLTFNNCQGSGNNGNGMVGTGHVRTKGNLIGTNIFSGHDSVTGSGMYMNSPFESTMGGNIDMSFTQTGTNPAHSVFGLFMDGGGYFQTTGSGNITLTCFRT